MKFGLMFFAASEDSLGPDKYRLVVESAQFGDRAGFSSVWVPERHFTGFGGLYPNPAVLHAALATITRRIRLQAGSVVAPLHHPLRIAEEWAVVDNLSHGRVGVSFASGWNPDDFIFFPDRYADRNDHMLESMRQVQALWRGEPFAGTSGVGKPTEVRVFPRPVQPELPVWLTVAGNPRNFERAGTCGANLLTHLLDQDEATLASKIALYRSARAAAGLDPATGIVSLMIHTLVGADADVVREQARQPYCNYIKANMGLFKGLEHSRGRDVDLSTMSESDLDEFVNFLYDRFAASRGLIGTPASCAPLVARLEAAGVNELACLLDFGPDVELILSNLPHLAALKELYSAVPVAEGQPSGFDRASVLARCRDVVTAPTFHSARTVWRRDGEALAELTLEPIAAGYHLPPASLDACSQILTAALPDFGRPDAPAYVPAGFASCDLPGMLTGAVWVHAVATTTGTTATGDVAVFDPAGQPLAHLTGVRLTAAAGPSAPVDPRDVADAIYERVWRAVPVPPAGDLLPARWCVIADQGGVATRLTARLTSLGHVCVPTMDAEVQGVVYLRSLDVAADGSEMDDVLRDLREVVAASAGAPVWLVTQGAIGATDPPSAVNPWQSAFWGFGRALAVERPGAFGGLVDLDPASTVEESVAAIWRSLSGGRTDDMVVWRAGTRVVPRLVRRPAVPSRDPAPAFSADDTILITGGSGGLGVRLAEWLIARGAGHILLCSRTAASAVPSRLGDTGADVLLVQADVSDRQALRAAMTHALAGRPPLTGVFHLAGVLDDGRLGEQAWERFEGVLAPKVAGAWHLHELTRAMPLKHFVLFSSVSSLLPAPGQTAYATANAFLDGLAQHRKALGLPAVSINWGPWAEVGHAQTEYGRQAHAHLASLGISALPPDLGLRALASVMSGERAQAAVALVDWARLRDADPSAARLGLLTDLMSGPTATPARVRPTADSALIAELVALPSDQRRPHLLQFLSDLVIAALKLRTGEPIDARQPLFDVGLDSIMALELKDRLERALGTPLSATLLFVHPTLDALSEYILREIVPVPAPALVVPPSHAALTEEELTRQLLLEIETSRGA